MLEHACLSYVSQSRPSRDEALNRAYSQYCASNIQNDVINQFSTPFKQYSTYELAEFILKHHL